MNVIENCSKQKVGRLTLDNLYSLFFLVTPSRKQTVQRYGNGFWPIRIQPTSLLFILLYCFDAVKITEMHNSY